MVAYYDFDTIKRYIAVFCTLFNNLYIQRKDSSGNLIKSIKVPYILADKDKAYYDINSNLEQTGAKLPLISISLIDMTYNIERQKNGMYGYSFLSKVNNGIKKFVENPTPYTFQFEVTIWAKKSSDLHKLLQQILAQFDPMIVKNVNILPEMNLADETKIIYRGFSPQSKLEFGEDAELKEKGCSLIFDLKGLLFKPIKDKKIIKLINLYLTEAGQKINKVDQYAHDDIINKKLLSVTDFDTQQVKTFSVSTTSERELYNYFMDINTEITTYGEKLKITDTLGNEYPFVYEYSNGEYYGYDNLIPDELTLTKTGKICILIPAMEENETKDFYISTTHNSNYEFANEILNIYVDFNRSVQRDVTYENKTQFDIIYNANSNLIIKTTDGNCKVFTNKSIGGDDKYFKIKFSDLDFENDKFICGLHTESENDYLYLKTDATNQTIGIHQVVNSTDTELTTISANTTISTIIFDFVSGALTINVDGQTYTFTPSISLIIPYINWNGESAASLDYILGYKK